jgi:hypothetical protein
LKQDFYLQNEVLVYQVFGGFARDRFTGNFAEIVGGYIEFFGIKPDIALFVAMF